MKLLGWPSERVLVIPTPYAIKSESRYKLNFAIITGNKLMQQCPWASGNICLTLNRGLEDEK